MTLTRTNLNDRVTVELTPYGLWVWLEEQRKLDLTPDHWRMPDTNPDGFWLSVQLWELFQVFGPRLNFGDPPNKMPFVGNLIEATTEEQPTDDDPDNDEQMAAMSDAEEQRPVDIHPAQRGTFARIVVLRRESLAQGGRGRARQADAREGVRGVSHLHDFATGLAGLVRERISEMTLVQYTRPHDPEATKVDPHKLDLACRDIVSLCVALVMRQLDAYRDPTLQLGDVTLPAIVNATPAGEPEPEPEQLFWVRVLDLSNDDRERACSLDDIVESFRGWAEGKPGSRYYPSVCMSHPELDYQVVGHVRDLMCEGEQLFPALDTDPGGYNVGCEINASEPELLRVTLREKS